MLAGFCAILGNLFWGISFLFIRTAMDVAAPELLLSHRFTLAALCMSIPLLLGKQKLSFRGKKIVPMLLMMLSQIAYYLGESYALQHTSSTIAGLVLAVVPIVTIGTGALFLKEYPTKRQAFFCLMPVAGVIIMTISGKELGVVTPMGILFLALTLLSSALFKTVNRKAAQEFTPFERTFLVLSVSAIFFSVTALREVGWNAASFVAPLANIRYLLPVLCLSLLNSIGANMLVNYASGKMSVFKVSSFGSLSTLCSVVAGMVFLKEAMRWDLALGAVLILVGIRQVTKPK
jgi:drug/metabolite transporter (DMT)-like permease